MRGARGQVTVFVLIGLSVLIVFLLIFAIRSMLLEGKTGGVSAQEYDARLIRNYVEQCVDATVEEGFLALGSQGGLLFTSQGGLSSPTDPLSETINADTLEQVRIAYGLTDKTDWPFHPPYGKDESTQFSYPFSNQPSAIATEPSELVPWKNLYSDGAYGQLALPALCDVNGPNDNTDDPEALQCPSTLKENRTGRYSPSVQSSLAAYIKRGVIACLAPDELAQLLGGTVSLDETKTNVTVTFTRKETLVTLDLPLSFSTDDGVVRTSTFSRRYPVRLYALSLYAWNLLWESSHSLSFRIDNEQSYKGVPGWDGFIVSKQRLTAAQAPGKELFVVSVLDPASKVKGSPYAFQFLVENRRPVLEWRNALIINNDATSLPFNADDPDGDALTATLTITPQPMGPSRTFPMTRQTSPPYAIPLTLLDKGNYKAKLEAKDDGILTDWQEFDLRITAPDLTVVLSPNIFFDSGPECSKFDIDSAKICNNGDGAAALPATIPSLQGGSPSSPQYMYNYPYDASQCMIDPGTPSQSTKARTLAPLECVFSGRLSLARFGFTPPGTFSATVDPTNAVRESREDNNYQTLTYTIP